MRNLQSRMAYAATLGTTDGNGNLMMTDPLIPFLHNTGYLILDGALATELEARDADLNDPLWSAKLLLDAPDLIRQVHYDYFAAGADVGVSASYQATFEGFERRGLTTEQAVALMRLSVQLVSQARDTFWADPGNRLNRLKPLVAASVGPYGAYLSDGSEYRGDYGLSIEALMDFHRPRLTVLADCVGEGMADLLACETIPCLAEGEALLRLFNEFSNIPAWFSFSCRDSEHVCHGERFADCVALAECSEQIVAVGLNCTPPEYVASLLRHAISRTSKPLLVYPNSGEQWCATTHTWVPNSTTSASVSMFQSWHEAGARLIGGCCRTTPETIRMIHRGLSTPKDSEKPHVPPD